VTGEDGICSDLLQHGIKIIIGHITTFFDACLVYGYIPLAKPGRDSYELAKSFRPDIFVFENDEKVRGFLHKSGTV
jgi:hypothetical protein